ncbi:MAG TPA: DNA repair and recombination protein RadB [Candidatus Nanoarchaeia archaeon]|nr:DNA repair and recombination protein RadB [Candidatus Nanoarchaeia archaeon]
METKVSSGTAELDWLLEGGYEKGVITAIYGPGGSGKSLLCMLCAAHSIKNQKIIYIDTEEGFSVTRFKQVCEDYPNVLDKIIFLKPTNFTEQTQSIQQLKEILVKQKIGLIVMDTISMHYRAELNDQIGKELNSQFVLQLRDLIEIARKKEIPVLVTSQVYSDLNEKDKLNIVGGLMIKNMSKCIIEIKKMDGKRMAVVRKHRSLPEGKEISFKITEKGIEEVKN